MNAPSYTFLKMGISPVYSYKPLPYWYDHDNNYFDPLPELARTKIIQSRQKRQFFYEDTLGGDSLILA